MRRYWQPALLSSEVPEPDGAPVRVALRIGIAAGPARRLLVGDPAVQRLDVVAGATVARAVAAQHRARPGEVVAARDVAGSDGEAPADGAFAPASRPPEAVAGAWWPAPAELELPSEAVEREEQPGTPGRRSQPLDLPRHR